MTTPQEVTKAARQPAHNRPVWAFASLAVFVVALVVLYVTGSDSGAGLFIALAVANLPTLVAAVSSEQAARDIRNGTVAAKAKQGALAAIDEREVMLRNGPVATAQLEALHRQLALASTTLEEVHTMATRNADVLDATAAALEVETEGGARE